MEGTKNVTELLHSDFEVTHLLYTAKYQAQHSQLIAASKAAAYEVPQKVLEATGSFKTNDAALAVAKLKENQPFDVEAGELAIALDDVRDPGNLGTIIRIADWYGIQKLILSPQTADFYNPKVLHSSMGSFTRVSFFYADLAPYLSRQALPVFGAFLEGQDIHRQSLAPEGIILMGNEANGISAPLEKTVSHKLTIPSFGHAESLNVAIATAVICDNFRRGKFSRSDV